MEWLHRFSRLEERLEITMRRQLDRFQQKLVWLEQGLVRQHPGRRLQPQVQRLDEIEQRLQRILATKLERLQIRVMGLATQLRLAAPGPRIARLQERQQALSQRLEAALRRRLERDAQRLAMAGHSLHTVSPLQTLGRGYAIVRHHPKGEVIRRAEQVQYDDRVEALLGEGRLVCRVEEAE
jgi:exodeoxyribonuclease VII large subunit